MEINEKSKSKNICHRGKLRGWRGKLRTLVQEMYTGERKGVGPLSDCT